MLVAFDPGRNVGVAYVSDDGELLDRAIVSAEAVAGVRVPEGAMVVVGDGTGATALVTALRAAGHEPVMVAEDGTTLEAKRLYYQANPPGLLARLVPFGMRSPGVLLDDYAAYAIAMRYLAMSATAV